MSSESSVGFCLTQKLTFDSVKDKLNSQPDIFYHDAKYYKESRFIFKERMSDITKWICKNLLFDPFELVFWLTIIDKEAFDILAVRLYTGLN